MDNERHDRTWHSVASYTGNWETSRGRPIKPWGTCAWARSIEETDLSYQEYLDAFHNLALNDLEVLQAVYEKVVDACREALLLQFARKSLILTANADDDTLVVQLSERWLADAAQWTQVDADEPWHGLVGSSFGWGWITVNQQGYCDGAMLSFAGICPTILLNVSASTINISRIVLEHKRTPVTV